MTTKRLPAHDDFAADAPLRTPEARAAGHLERRVLQRSLNASDGTRQLLVSGFWVLVVGCLAGSLAATVFGGVGPQGARTNAGWLALILAMMATPFAILLLLLGGAKWVRNLRLSRRCDE